MQRRNFFRAASSKLSGVAAVAAGYGTQMGTAASDGAAELKAQVEALKGRIDDLDARDKRRFRMLVTAVAVSTGVDISMLLG